MKKSLAEDTRGAVYVEFLIAFIPVLVFFLCLLQLSLLFSIKLAVDHAAVVGARAAAVVIGDEPKRYGNEPMNRLSNRREQAVKDAVVLTLAPYILDGSLNKINVVYPRPNQVNGADAMRNQTIAPMDHSNFQMIRVRVEAEARCKIALANRVACISPVPTLFGIPLPIPDFLGRGFYRIVKGEAIFPSQGARYQFKT